MIIKQHLPNPETSGLTEALVKMKKVLKMKVKNKCLQINKCTVSFSICGEGLRMR
jgi:hypothetical protein